MSETRKLTTILAADVAGYSRLAAADEERTLARLRALRADLIDPAVSLHLGRVVKWTGDGMLVEFRSPVEAVRCAIEVQTEMAKRNSGLPSEKRIDFRVGIHLGDVVEEADGDLMGDGVNIAARLEGISEPGAIYLSRATHEQVDGKIAERFIDLGDKELKNIGRKVRVFAIEQSTDRRESVVTSTPESALRLSIVVLPFANLGGDPEQEYFVDGVTESLTTDLSRISGSFVIARNTAFTFKGRPVDVKQVGRDLNVRYVLEGSVQRGGNRLRVNVQLIGAENGNHLWADRFDKPVADLFDMQDEIVARLANALNAELVAAEARKAERETNPDAIDYCFRGHAAYNRGINRENVTEAAGWFEKALTLAPDNVDALAGLAMAHASMAGALLTDDRAGALAKGEIRAKRAIHLAPNHALSHEALGWIFAHSKVTDRAIVEFEQAIALDRNRAFAFAGIGYAKSLIGHAEETEGYIKEAFRLSPRDVQRGLWNYLVGCSELLLGRDDKAVLWFQRAIDENHQFSAAYFFLAAALAHLGKQREAKHAAASGATYDPSFSVRRAQLATVPTEHPIYLRQRERIYEGLRLAGVPEGEPDKPAAPRLSIVVLPFANLGGDPEQEYFVDGVTESLTTDLSRISGSFVIARNTAFTYKGKAVDVKQIGRDLNVRYVLEGSVQRGGNRLRVNVQLIDAETGNHLWAERFDKPVADLFDMQDEIVARLANQLGAELIAAEARRAERNPHPDSVDLYFQGMAWLNKGSTPEYLDQARRFFDNALALDALNLGALVGHGIVDTVVGATLYGTDRASRTSDAEGMFTKALSLAPDHPLAHAGFGWLLIATNRAARGIAECERALALDRNLALAHATIGLAYFLNGRCAETEACINEALRLSPRDANAYVWMSYAGCARAYLGANEDAVAWFRRGIETNRNFSSAHFWLAATLANLGRIQEARAEVSAGLALDPNFTVSRFRGGAASDHPTFLAQRERFVSGMQKAGVLEGEREKPAAPRLSIVVLPFANIGGDPEQEYFVDGVTESLTTDLSRIAGSFVIARNTAFTYKGKPVDVKEIGRELNVRYVLEGSVQRSGNRLRVNVQLIDAEMGNHLWGERFDKAVVDLFDMQDEIVSRLANQLGTQLISAEARRAEHRPDPDSMDIYFQGLACINKGWLADNIAQARNHFEQALMLDPENLEALVGTATVDAIVGTVFYVEDRAERLARAEATLSNILSLAPDHAAAHMWMGRVHNYTNRATRGIADCERALALDRNLALAHAQIGLAKLVVGRGQETEAHVKEALRFSPRDSTAYTWMTIAGFAKIMLGADDEGVTWLRRSVETNPNTALSHILLGAGLALQGRLDEARAAILPGLALDPSFTVRRYRVGAPTDNATYLAQRERIYDGMRKAGVPEA